ncbi:MAG: methylmalonyl-CoA mutase small subunit [Paludibacteraceae bacterium]|nr:methylmalonyl-CoA mutase small subunit [Paludibacteraceae bacterium]
MAGKKLNLLADFPAVSTEEWMAKITADLKGVPFEKKLIWKTDEGFNVNPFYRQEDVKGMAALDSAPGKFPFVRGTKESNEWLVRQNICVECPKEANAKALDVLTKGVNSLGFCLSKDDLNAETIATLLKGICPECVELNFNICPCSSETLINLLVDYFRKNNVNLEKVHGSVNCDPMKNMLAKGRKPSMEKMATHIVAAVKAAECMPEFRVVAVNSAVLNHAGAFCAQELGYALAWGAEYMTLMTEAGIKSVRAGRAIKFNMGVGGNYFMEIAKFRAARMLWAMIVKAYEPECDCACKMKIHAETSRFNKTIYDAHVNLLRSETEAMSAAIAGVDSMTVNPFDITYKKSDDFSERIARNQQLLLKEESHFDKVTDVAGGSYYIENLTQSIAKEAWRRFLEIQAAGGMYQMILNGKVVEDIKATQAKRLENVSKRKEVLLGTNQFPNFNEMAAAKIEDQACGCKCCCQDEKAELETLPMTRAAEQFEALRLETEKSGKRPKAFMLTIGNLAMRLARAQFSCNFLACAGYQVIDNLGFETVEDGVAAARKAGADIIVLCSSDDEYAELAPACKKTIGDGKEIFIVAGAPACMDDLKAQGIENFIHVKCNVLETLKAFNKQLL